MRVFLDRAGGLRPAGRDQDVLAVDAALRLLAEEDPRKAQVVELRFFGGLTVEETAVALERLGAHGSQRLGVCPGVAVPNAEPRHAD